MDFIQKEILPNPGNTTPGIQDIIRHCVVFHVIHFAEHHDVERFRKDSQCPNTSIVFLIIEIKFLKRNLRFCQVCRHMVNIHRKLKKKGKDVFLVSNLNDQESFTISLTNQIIRLRNHKGREDVAV